MTLHVFGDSHSMYLFGRVREAKVHHLGSWTMHRVARDGAPTLDDVRDGDDVLFVFGEIDVRCHLVRLAQERGVEATALVDMLAADYVAATVRASVRYPSSKFSILGVVPPIDPLKVNREVPVVGLLHDRVAARQRLNQQVQKAASSAGIAFVPIPDFYETNDGSLRRAMSDGHAHIAMDCAGAVCDAAARVLDLPLTFRRSPQPMHALKCAARHLAAAARRRKDLWKLGTA